MQGLGLQYKLNFNKLSKEELIEYVNLHGRIPSQRNLVQQVEGLFNSEKNITYAIADLVIAEIMLDRLPNRQLGYYYYEKDIKNLTPENVIYFRQMFQLNDEDEILVKERIYRILSILGAIIPDSVDENLELCKICPKIENFRNMCKYCSILIGSKINDLPGAAYIYIIFFSIIYLTNYI